MFQKLIDLIIEPHTRTESRSSASVSTDLQGTSLFHYWHQSLLLLTCRAPVSFSTDLQCTSLSLLTCSAPVFFYTDLQGTGFFTDLQSALQLLRPTQFLLCPTQFLHRPTQFLLKLIVGVEETKTCVIHVVKLLKDNVT